LRIIFHRGRPTIARLAATALAFCAGLAMGGCTTTYSPQRLSAPGELIGVQTKTVADVTVSVAVLTDEQSRRHFGADLGRHGVQAVWMSVRNASVRKLWFISNLLDRDFYSAEETAQMVSNDVPDSAMERVRQDYRDESMRVLLLPGTITEGYVFLPRAEGGRYLGVRLMGDVYDEDTQRASMGAGPLPASPPRELRFDFAMPLPDGDFDYEQMDAYRAYRERPLPDLDVAGLRAALEQLPCCATDEDGERNGDPLNVIIVGEAADVLNSLSRSGWSFTHRITLRTVEREIRAALFERSYPVAPVSSLYAFGRKQDLALQRARPSIAQRNHMRLWWAPFRFEGRPVWVGQVSRDIGIKVTPKSPTLTTHIIDPQVDTTREYLLHSLMAEGLVDRFGFVRGSAVASRDKPLLNLMDDPYFSDGMRVVIMLAPEPVPPDQVRSLLWERSAPPIAEGQSDIAGRNVRPIEPIPTTSP
jgi:hypothetical protein